MFNKKIIRTFGVLLIPTVLVILTTYINNIAIDCNSRLDNLRYEINTQYFRLTNDNIKFNGVVPYTVTERDFTNNNFQLHIATSTENLITQLLQNGQADFNTINSSTNEAANIQKICNNDSALETNFLYASLLASLIVAWVNFKEKTNGL